MPLTVVDHPLAADLLTQAARQADRAGRSSDPSRDGWARSWSSKRRGRSPVTPVEVETPLEPFTGSALAVDLVAIPVLRAGLGLLDAVTDLYPEARMVGYLGHGARRGDARAA